MTPDQAAEILSLLTSIKETVQLISATGAVILSVLVFRLWLD